MKVIKLHLIIDGKAACGNKKAQYGFELSHYGKEESIGLFGCVKCSEIFDSKYKDKKETAQ